MSTTLMVSSYWLCLHHLSNLESWKGWEKLKNLLFSLLVSMKLFDFFILTALSASIVFFIYTVVPVVVLLSIIHLSNLEKGW
uniref:Uncharacterized protein n=1 Tax=Rhizophora mucronata TaxID=61149 RepID=A0A2P2K9S0_RHIMU